MVPPQSMDARGDLRGDRQEGSPGSRSFSSRGPPAPPSRACSARALVRGTARTSSRSSVCQFFDHRMDRCPRREANEGGDAPAGAFVEVRATYSVPGPRRKPCVRRRSWLLDARALFWTRPNSAIRRPTDCPDQSFGRLPALKLSRFSSWVTASRGLLAEPSGHEPGGPHADSEHDQDARTGLLSGRDCAYNRISTSPRPGPFREVPDQRVFPNRR
jgi:hypothetical protein